ncbi:MAG: methylmalonyl-CoA epimerase [Streptosporangiales bacterium]
MFTRIDHIGIAVPDLDEAKRFYESTFGMRVTHEETNEDQGVREAMLAPGPDTAGDAGAEIQLMAPARQDSAIAKFLERSGPGIHQVAFTVDDIDREQATLLARGLRLAYPEARRGTAGTRVNFIHPKDAGGVLVELVEHAEATDR